MKIIYIYDGSTVEKFYDDDETNSSSYVRTVRVSLPKKRGRFRKIRKIRE